MASKVDLSFYHLTYDAEMTSAAEMGRFRTTFENGQRALYYNREAEAYADYDSANPASPFSFADGALTITARPTPFFGQPYTSGMISTLGDFSQSEGYFEIRAATTGAHGFWPAFWMLPQGAGLPEIDVLEQPNNNGASSYWNYVSAFGDKSGGFVDVGTDLSKGYHTYGVLWTVNTIQFSFDGQLIGTPTATPAALVNQKLYMIANLAVGDASSWPGAPQAGASASMSIDYIRAYSADPTIAAVALQPVSSPDGANTMPAAASSSDAVMGAGPDVFTFSLSEDAYRGDAQFVLHIDGVQQGGVLSTSAVHALGQSQAFAVAGKLGSGAHSARVTFLNDLWGGAGNDRNLFVDGVTYNGSKLTPDVAALWNAGTARFAIAERNVPVFIGAGEDVIRFSVSESAFQGDAHYVIRVDGVQQGGVQTATASHAAGETQSVEVRGNFGGGRHVATVDFLNDAYGSGPTQDRNLFVDSASFNGRALTPASAALAVNGPVDFVRPGDPDTLTLSLTEDAWQGDARAEISVDGRVRGSFTVTAPHGGPGQTVSLSGDFGLGAHTVGVNFLNDAWGGAGADRNLYVGGLTFNGVAHPEATADMYNGGLVTFAV